MPEINNSSLGTFPYSAIGFLRATFADGSVKVGVGTVVGQNDVLTALSLIYDPDLGYAKNVDFYFGADYNVNTGLFDNQPYSPSSSWQAAIYPSGPFSDSDNGSFSQSEIQYNITVIALSEPIGYRTGWFDLHSGHNSNGQTLTTIGFKGSQGMVSTQTTVDKSTFASVYVSEIDPFLGQDDRSLGSPLFTDDNYLLGMRITTLEWVDIGLMYEWIISMIKSNNSWLPDWEVRLRWQGSDTILEVITSSIADYRFGTFTFQWLANGQAVIGANEATYDLSALDVGKLIAVEVSYVDGSGTTKTVFSNGFSITENINRAPSGKIKISGSLELGAVITPDTSALQDANGLGGFSYLWLDEEGEIVSRDLSLAITESVLGKSLQFKLSYTDGDLFEESVLSELITIPSDSNDVISLDIGGNTINGYDGLDQVVYGDNYEGVTVTKTSSGWEISSEAGTDTLEGVERLEFADKKLALDIDGNAGAVAKLLGAFLGAEGVQITEYVTIGLEALDSGTSFEDLLQLALDTVFGSDPSSNELVSTFYKNLTGQTAPQDIIDTYATLIDSGSLTPLELATQVAEHPLNAESINLIGLATTGIEYA